MFKAINAKVSLKLKPKGDKSPGIHFNFRVTVRLLKSPGKFRYNDSLSET